MSTISFTVFTVLVLVQRLAHHVLLRRGPNIGNGTGEFDILVATNVAFGALEPVCPAETIENGKMEV